MGKKFDFLAIGECLRDVFYMLDEASISCSINKEKCLLCLEYAEKIPVKTVIKVHAAGNSANAAVSASRLGLRSCLVSWVGDDEEGRDIVQALRKDKVDVSLISKKKTEQTSEATILSYQGERTQLVSFKKRSYETKPWPETKALYYSAMGHGYSKMDRKILAHLTTHPGTRFFFQPGTTHIRNGLDRLKPLVARSDIFILNDSEARLLLGDGERPMRNMLEAFRNLGANTIVITNGRQGADAFDGQTHWHMPIFPGDSLESTGAGDSFASAFCCALLDGTSLPEALRWGTANSWSVIKKIGPQSGLLDKMGMKKVLDRHKKIQPRVV